MPLRGQRGAMATSLDDALAAARLRRRLPDPALRRLIRQRAGVSQDAVAEALGIDRASVSRYESGRRTPCAAVLRRYLDVLDRLVEEARA